MLKMISEEELNNGEFIEHIEIKIQLRVSGDMYAEINERSFIFNYNYIELMLQALEAYSLLESGEDVSKIDFDYEEHINFKISKDKQSFLCEEIATKRKMDMSINEFIALNEAIIATLRELEED